MTKCFAGVLRTVVLTALTCCLCVRAAKLTAAAPAAVPGEFRVATWNVRSGEGRCPIGLTCPFRDSTPNCTDPAAPLNAWGLDIPQAQLRNIGRDPSLVALGVEEAWTCGAPAAVKSALGWSYASASFNGTGLVTRFGIRGTLQSRLLSPAGASQTFVLGADVCVDASCSATLRVYVTHFQFSAPDDHLIDQTLVTYAQAMLAWIATQPHAGKHVLVGDFNAFEREVEASIPCELTFDHQTPALILAAGYTDAWLALHGTALGLTATLNRNGCGLQNGGPFKRIDYGYLKGYTPVTSAVFAVVPVNTPAPSDHYGLLTGFTGAPDPADPPPPPTRTLTLLPAGEILLRAADDAAPHLSGRWAITADATANGGRQWTNSNLNEPKIATPMASPLSYFEVRFTAAAGTPYRLWLRMHAQADSYSNDSVWVQFSDSLNVAGTPAYRVGTAAAMPVILEAGTNAGVSGWGWADNGYDVPGTAVVFEHGGLHTIRIQQREDGPGIDQILLSPGAYLSAPPGPAKQDATLFRPTQTPQ